MSDAHADDHKHFDAEKIFVILFVFTALEIGWGYLADWAGWNRFWKWTPLSLCAVVKFWYILLYFMHFKYERMIVKGMVYLTPFLILVIFLNTRPDVASNDYVDYKNGARYNPHTNQVEEDMDHMDSWIEEQIELRGGH